MEIIIKEKRPSQAKNKKAATKAVILLAFIITALLVFHFTPAKIFFSAARLESFLENIGVWAPPGSLRVAPACSSLYDQQLFRL